MKEVAGWAGGDKHTILLPSCPKKIPARENTGSGCTFPHGWASGLGTLTLFSKQLFWEWVMTFQTL